MKYFKLIFIANILIFFGSCKKDKDKEDLEWTKNYLFEDGFETTNNSFDELFPTDGSRWTTTQKMILAMQPIKYSFLMMNFQKGILH